MSMTGKWPLLLFALSAVPAAAQDVGPALDPGAMVGWAGGAAVQADNERRAGTKPAAPMGASEAVARKACANRYATRAKLGRDHPTTKRLFALCRKAGYY
ncbi:hypothetical protein [Sphingomonas sp.]|uniref:hypothetical protein n=1 Tax=Sphingomonas sp. TaxID=28214 RepID=UPI003B3A5C67